jgi:CDP-glycerol glycerophosphotransferase (TagB/SpsB family)
MRTRRQLAEPKDVVARYLFFVSELYALAILRPLQAAIWARGDEAAWFFERDRTARFVRVDELRLESVRAVRQWRPEAVFVPGNWVPDFFPGLKVEVFHGFNVGKRSDERGHFRLRGWFDLYCTQGPATTNPFLELAAQHGYFRVAETGWPKLDPLFSGAYDAQPHERPTILYASTFTERISSARILRATIASLAAAGEWRWLVTLHPKMAEDVVASYRALEGPNLTFVETDDILQLYARAEVLLSDTSSVVPEFLTQRKPVVTYRNTRPGPHLLNVERVEDVEPALRRALETPADLKRAIDAYVCDIHPYSDGRSSERVLDATQKALSERRSGLKRKPLNLGRRLQARWRMRHFGL